jgi:glycosyltransferase involved in cell wall biosynthesis
MKILHISYSDNIGGASRAAYRIHQAQLKSGINSQMLVLVKTTSDDTVIRAKDFINSYRYKFNRIAERFFNRIFNLSGSEPRSLGIIGSGLWRFINRFEADIVHLHWVNGGILSLGDISKISLPIVWTFHDLWPLNGLTHYDSEKDQTLSIKQFKIINVLDDYLKRRKTKLIFSKNIQCIANSKWTARQISKKLGVGSATIPILPYPIDLEFWSRKNSQIDARNALGIPTDKRIIMFGAPGGSSDPRKGFDLLEKALLFLSDEMLETTSLVVFGGDFDLAFLKHDNIICLGPIFNDIKLRTVYEASDVVVMPSRLETFGQVALEAIACGSPVVAFSTSGLKDVISHKITGYLAKPYDSRDLHDGICWCLDEQGKFNSHEWYANVNKFGNQQMAKKYQIFYNNLCERF